MMYTYDLSVLGLVPKSVQFAPNLGEIGDIFTSHFRAKMYWIWFEKMPGFVPFGASLTNLGWNLVILVWKIANETTRRSRWCAENYRRLKLKGQKTLNFEVAILDLWRPSWTANGYLISLYALFLYFFKIYLYLWRAITQKQMEIGMQFFLHMN